MNSPARPHGAPDLLASYFWSGDAIRSRSVSRTVPSTTLDVPAPPERLVADWARDIAQRLALEPGDVEPLPLARARTRWPDYKHCVQAVADWEREMSLVLDLAPGDVEQLPLVRARARWPDYRRCVQAASDWTASLGLGAVLASSDIALMACRGARYHHDGAQYGSAAFCNLFLSEDKGLDVHFPGAGVRMPLARGTAVIFDTCQPHAVVRRGSSGFDAADFPAGGDDTLVFLTWELPIEQAEVARLLGLSFDIDPATAALQLDAEQVRLNGEPVEPCPGSGRWRRAE